MYNKSYITNYLHKIQIKASSLLLSLSFPWRACTIKNYGFVMFKCGNKLMCLSKAMEVTDSSNNIQAYYKICPFTLHYKSMMFHNRPVMPRQLDSNPWFLYQKSSVLPLCRATTASQLAHYFLTVASLNVNEAPASTQNRGCHLVFQKTYISDWIHYVLARFCVITFVREA